MVIFQRTFSSHGPVPPHFGPFGTPQQPEQESVVGILQKMAIRDLVKSYDSIEDGVIVSVVENPFEVKVEQPVENNNVKPSLEPEQTKTESEEFCHETQHIEGTPESTQAQ